MGFLAEDVLAGIDGGFEEDGMEVAGGGDEHDIDVALEDLLVGVEAEEAVIVVDGDLIALDVFDAVAAAFDFVFEEVGHGDELDVVAGIQGVDGGAGATAATADEADLESAGSCSMDRSGQGQASSHDRHRLRGRNVGGTLDGWCFRDGDDRRK